MSNHTDPAAIHETASALEERFANLICVEAGYPQPSMDEINAAEANLFDYMREHRDVLSERDYWKPVYRNLHRHDLSQTPEGVRTYAAELQDELGGLYTTLSTPIEDKFRFQVTQAAAQVDGELEVYLYQHKDVLESDPAWSDHFARQAAEDYGDPADLGEDALDLSR